MLLMSLRFGMFSAALYFFCGGAPGAATVTTKTEGG
jgi:hypothetical protein